MTAAFLVLVYTLFSVAFLACALLTFRKILKKGEEYGMVASKSSSTYLITYSIFIAVNVFQFITILLICALEFWMRKPVPLEEGLIACFWITQFFQHVNNFFILSAVELLRQN